jgi:hypothetical protein
VILALANEWAYVGWGWAISAVGLGAYIAAVLRRGKALSRRVPDEEQRWM